MFPINQAIPRALNTPPDEVMPYHLPSCRTNNCTWPSFSTLAVCVDMKSSYYSRHITDLHACVNRD